LWGGKEDRWCIKVRGWGRHRKKDKHIQGKTDSEKIQEKRKKKSANMGTTKKW